MAKDARKKRKKADIRTLEAKVIYPPEDRGLTTWPIKVEEAGLTAYVRLGADKSRLVYDFKVAEEMREQFDGSVRIKRQIPRPSGGVDKPQDPGHNPGKAEAWLRRWLADTYNESLGDGAGGSIRNSANLNDVEFSRVARRYMTSPAFTKLDPATQQQYEKWVDFLDIIALGPGFSMNQLGSRVVASIPDRWETTHWERTRADGKTLSYEPGSWNTGIKVMWLLKRICSWAMSEPDEDSPTGFVLDSNPFERIREQDLPTEREEEKGGYDIASDEYAEALADASRAILDGSNGRRNGGAGSLQDPGIGTEAFVCPNERVGLPDHLGV